MSANPKSKNVTQQNQKIVRYVEQSKHIDWHLMTQENQHSLDYFNMLSKKFSSFFKVFPDHKLKFGQFVIDSNQTFSQIKEFIKAKQKEIDSFSPIGSTMEERAKDLIEAIKDPEVCAVWFQGGGNPSKIKESETQAVQFIYELHKATVDLSLTNPKPIIGYCLSVPAITYLSARSLAVAIHGPLPWDVEYLGSHNTVVNKLKNIFSDFSLQPQTFKGLTPLNAPSHKLISGELKPNGFVIGGLLQIVFNSLQVALLAEKEINANIVSGKPIILFIELLDFGSEFKLVEEIIKLVAENKLDVKAFCLGYTTAKHSKNNSEKENYEKQCQEKLNQIAELAGQNGIPVASGLKSGHSANNEPIVFGRATLSFTKSNGELKLIYDKKTLGFLDLKRNLLWNNRQLNKQPLDDKTENLSNLCSIL